jgi:hypothetical protein
MEEKPDEIAIGLADRTGALMMINKKERILIKELLSVTLKSPSAKEWIMKKLGREYIQIGEKLLKAMGE